MHVPHIWPLEVTNALARAFRRKRITREELFDYARQLGTLRAAVDFDRAAEHTFTDILALDERYQLTTYDACYLELAQRRGLPLATADSNLVTKHLIRSVGIGALRLYSAATRSQQIGYRWRLLSFACF